MNFVINRLTVLGFFFALLLFIAFSGAVAFAQTVSGKVMDQNGRPVPNARVTIANQDWRSADALTDLVGNFFVSSLPGPGQYYIEIYWRDNLVFRKRYEIESDFDAGELRL